MRSALPLWTERTTETSRPCSNQRRASLWLGLSAGSSLCLPEGNGIKSCIYSKRLCFRHIDGALNEQSVPNLVYREGVQYNEKIVQVFKVFKFSCLCLQKSITFWLGYVQITSSFTLVQNQEFWACSTSTISETLKNEVGSNILHWDFSKNLKEDEPVKYDYALAPI